MNFEEKLKQLENIAVLMKQDNGTLDETISSFEEGIKLATELEKDLTSYEKKIQILLNDNENYHLEEFK
ncbi:MAG: exodeoxyribonuclease VII small subunit [Spirochaetaceae bacterium]